MVDSIVSPAQVREEEECHVLTVREAVTLPGQGDIKKITAGLKSTEEFNLQIFEVLVEGGVTGRHQAAISQILVSPNFGPISAEIGSFGGILVENSYFEDWKWRGAGFKYLVCVECGGIPS